MVVVQLQFVCQCLFLKKSLSNNSQLLFVLKQKFFLFADKHCRPLAELHYQSTVWSAGSMADSFSFARGNDTRPTARCYTKMIKRINAHSLRWNCNNLYCRPYLQQSGSIDVIVFVVWRRNIIFVLTQVIHFIGYIMLLMMMI